MIELDGSSLTVELARRVVFDGEPVRPAPAALERVQASYEVLARAAASGRPIYGVNTGFGKLSDRLIPPEEQGALQENLLRSHAAGVGEPLPEEAVRAVLLFRLNALLKGYSGVRPKLIGHLVELLNRGVCPRVPAKGSVGASGDLAPLAHLALVLIGEGEATVEGERLPGREALRRVGLEPLKLEPKEGLALINGTQVSLAEGFLAYLRAERILRHAELLTALALEGWGGRLEPLDPKLHEVRPHPGQREVAARILELLRGSRLLGRAGEVQDPYSLRCAPQILGATRDALEFVRGKLELEMNSATDNPLVFPETGEVLSGGNFHGQPLALALELLGQATAEVGSLAERQINLLLSAPGLPEFLAARPGLTSGLMLAQYTAAALVSENKVLAHPAAVDSIPTSAGKEDHNSLSSLAAQKAQKIAANVEYILAIGLLVAAWAVELRGPAAMAPATRRIYERIREAVGPRPEQDQPLTPKVERLRELIAEEALLDVDGRGSTEDGCR